MPLGPEKNLSNWLKCQKCPRSSHMCLWVGLLLCSLPLLNSSLSPSQWDPSQQLLSIPVSEHSFWNERIAISSPLVCTVGLSTKLGWGELQFEVRSSHPAYQQHWRHCKEPAGILWRCDPLFYLSNSHYQALSLTYFACLNFFAFFLSCLILLIHCFVRLRFLSHLVTISLSLFS